MASAIDSGVDTGNDSNDSSAQEKNFKMDCDNPRTQAPMPVINPTNQALEEKKDQSQPQSSNEMLTKDDSGPGMSLIHLQSSKPTWSIPVESEPKTILEYNTEDFCEIKRVFTVGGPFGIDYEDHPLMTKLRRGLPFRSRCIRNRAMDSYVRIRDITRICRAVCHNNTEAVKKLLESGMSPNCHDSYKRTPLHIASCMGYTDMVKLLLDNGADPNAKDSIGNTPLHLAACTNHVSVITLLLKAGTRVSELDRAGHSPLRLAITKFNLMERSIMSHPVLKKQVFQVISMLTEYMNQKKGADHIDPDVLNKFEALVRISDSNEQVESNIRDLLNNLSSLSLSGPS
ncbi:ankyrin repeat domain-containing protein 54-like [Homalodisca vitripennis]|uniref:ankyrin repeat domain-containing protein 54-like n=1 Tax=Homalodisca vitripennis TaxID=197043 RepID=UPI001EEA4DB5|nr:ankyrin repeat domain-containing protein 54-like [Homalodisca vitripennis]KAG8274130.1 hypothetical protein J6590_004146 [Homalodisca vitripennis]